MRAFLGLLSEDSRRLRYFSGGADLDGAAGATVDVTYPGSYGIVATRGNDRIVAHATYCSATEDRAEVAFAVADELQGLGIATTLLAHPAEAAAAVTSQTSDRGTGVWPRLGSGLVEAMSQASFYPHEPARVELIETHISWVFVAGDLVYKVKKPVVFPFLDYGTSERRRLLCHEEVRLNSRLAPDLYLGVRGLARGRDRWTLTDAEDVDASEHAVEMRRFDEERTLERHLERGGVDPAQIVALGRKVAAFHRAASPLPPERGGAVAQARLVNENFESLMSFEAIVPARALAAAQRFSSAFLSARGAQLDRRARAGLVRDGHGDLRAEHVLLMDGGIEVFDCIEFSPQLRGIDVGSDLAFLVMDLEAHERADLARGRLPSRGRRSRG